MTIEIPHLLRLVEGREYDTIYHEHYSYLSLLTTQRVLAAGRADGRRRRGAAPRTADRCAPGRRRPRRPASRPRGGRKVLADEAAAGLHTLEGHDGFAAACRAVRNDLVEFLVDCSRKGAQRRRATALRARATRCSTTAGSASDLLAFTVDRNPFKHGRFLPGTHIPIHPAEKLAEERPDYILILPWNLRAEITEQLEYTREWGARLVVPLPALEVF